MKANNIVMTNTNFGKICAYVMQEDVLMDCLTPRESLIFGAKLKLKGTNEQINKRVESLIRKVIYDDYFLYSSSDLKNVQIRI